MDEKKDNRRTGADFYPVLNFLSYLLAMLLLLNACVGAFWLLMWIADQISKL